MKDLIREYEEKMLRKNFNFTRSAPATTISAAEEILRALLPEYYFLKTHQERAQNQYRPECVNTHLFNCLFIYCKC